MDVRVAGHQVDTGESLRESLLLEHTYIGSGHLLLGLVPTVDPGRQVTYREFLRPAFDLADRLGFDRSRLATLAIPTPACGLAGATPAWARRALTLSRELGDAFLDPPDAT